MHMICSGEAKRSSLKKMQIMRIVYGAGQYHDHTLTTAFRDREIKFFKQNTVYNSCLSCWSIRKHELWVGPKGKKRREFVAEW